MTIENWTSLEIRLGRIDRVEDFPEARKPAYKVCVDFGGELGCRWSSVQACNYRKAELIGLPVLAVTNLPAKRIAGFESQILILGVPGDDGQVSLLTVTKPALLGGRVY